MEEKIIHGTYHIADCEHNGDIERAKQHLRNILPNVRITFDYWDGYDCGEAYINFEFSSKHFHKVYEKLCDVATFDADVNEYVSLPNQSLYKGIKCSKNAFNERLSVLKNNWANNWENNIPITLFFEHSANFNPLLVIERAKQALPTNHKMIAYNTELVDGNQFYNVLFTCSLEDIDEQKLEDFGDYAFSWNRNSFLKKNGIYGEMRLAHNIKTPTRNIEFCKTLAKKIINKEPIIYNNGYCTETFSYDEYMVYGVFRNCIVIKGRTAFNVSKDNL